MWAVSKGWKAVPYRVTPKAHAGWQQFARSNGVSMAALFEVIGRCLDDEGQFPPEHLLVEWAHEVDVERRSRERGDTSL